MLCRFVNEFHLHSVLMWTYASLPALGRCLQTKKNYTVECEVAQHLAKYCQLVVRQQAIGLIHKKVSSYELLEAPVFTLHEPIRTLTLCNEHKNDCHRKRKITGPTVL